MFHCRLKGLKKELEQEFSGPVIGLGGAPGRRPAPHAADRGVDEREVKLMLREEKPIFES